MPHGEVSVAPGFSLVLGFISFTGCLVTNPPHPLRAQILLQECIRLSLISVISQSEGITKELGRKIQGKQRWSPVVPGEIGQAMLYSTFKGGGGGYDQMQGQAFMPGKRRGGGVGWRVQRCSKSLSWLKIIETPNGSKWLPWDKRT